MNLMPKNANKYYCEKCDFNCSKQSNWASHLSTRKHKNRTYSNDLEQYNAEINNSLFTCECGKE